MSCSYENCDFECYESNDKCIFHYDKKDWLSSEGEWKNDSQEEIKYFWSEIRRLKIDTKFIGFIFPKFEEYTSELNERQEGKYITSESSYIDNTNFGRIKNSNFPLLDSSNFTDAIFLDDANFFKIFLSGNIIMDNTIFEKNISFSWKKLSSISFNHVQFKQDMDFRKYKIYACKFENIIFKNKIDFRESTLSGISFGNSTFEQDVDFDNTEIKGNMKFINTTFQAKAIFSNGSFEDNTEFKSSTFKDVVSFENRKFQGNIDFSNVKSKDINFRSGKINSLIRFSGKYGKVDFSSVEIDGNIGIEASEFNAIILSNTNITKTANFIIKNTKIDEFILNHYDNKSEEKVLFHNVTVNNRLKISHITFNNEEFTQFNLTRANIEIMDSAFNSNFFNTVKWGKISASRYKASRDIFRQLKFFSEQQKNFIDADGFYSLEMRERKKELKEEGNNLEGLEKVKHLLTDTVVFYIHEKTSNFSQNWVLPILWLFLLGMIGVICKNFNITTLNENISFLLPISILLFLLPLIYEKIKKFIIYWYLFIPIISLYIAFSKDKLDDIAVMINPLKIFTSISSTSISGEFIYLLYKIAILFLVYQVIVAMKKKVRSK